MTGSFALLGFLQGIAAAGGSWRAITFFDSLKSAYIYRD
jgi:hypothetical protein